jgi:2-polyprenyl-6-hydroxyphenyl methylase/3-demethylubiquinone-9 3-methyltransferase
VTLSTVSPVSTGDYYDRYWSADPTPHYEPGHELAALLAANAGPGDRVLDVGCGAGNSYAPPIAQRVASYTGVDASAAAVELARAGGLDATVIDDAASLPFPDGEFDLAICIEVFEHLFEPHRAAAEIRRVLRPGGRLVASTPNALYWRLRLDFLAGRWNPLGDELSGEQPWRDPHIRFFGPDTLARMLRSAGFARVEVHAHGGRLLDHLTRRPTDFGQSRLYRAAERRFPALLGTTLQALAVK